jgi:hypothetical protein
MSPAELRDALWEAMVGRAEALHDLVVISQRSGSVKAAARIEVLAADLRALARIAAMRAKP